MADKKRKKSSRMRGSKTHGYGSMKKHRGAGHRGGRGNAGSGKRADSKKPSLWKTHVSGKDPQKTGFTSWLRITNTTLNVGHLSSMADTLVSQGKATLQQGTYTINLADLGYTKLLGAGTVVKKLHVVVPIAVPLAQEKIVAAGGTLQADRIVDKNAVRSERQAKVAQKKQQKEK